MGKVAVFSSITGAKDNILEVNRFAGVDYWMFTEEANGPTAEARGWQHYCLPEWSTLTKPARRNAKLPKIMPFFCLPQYEYVIWQDGSHMVQVDPHEILQDYIITPDKDFASFQHGRDHAGMDYRCIYKEAENIKSIGWLEDPAVVDRQMAAYRAEGFPEDFGLSCTAGMIWHNVPRVRHLQLTWFEQVCHYSSRDQLSLFYSIWKTDMKDRLSLMKVHWCNNDIIKKMAGHTNPRQ